MRSVKPQLRITSWPERLPVVAVERPVLEERDGWLFEVETRAPAELPPELILRDFLKLECKPDEVLRFMNEYGSTRMDPESFLLGSDDLLTDGGLMQPEGSFRHLAVAVASIDYMQRCVRHWVAYREGLDVSEVWASILDKRPNQDEAWRLFAGAFTALGRFHPVVVVEPFAYSPIPRMGLLSGLAAQLFNLTHDEAPILRCANTNCERWFVRQQGRSEKGQSRTSGVKYCSPPCAKAAAQREYRRRSVGAK